MILEFEFNCASCGGPNILAWKYCPYCGKEHKPRGYIRGQKNGDRYAIQEFRQLLQPIVDLNGYTWIARRVGVNESYIRRLMNRDSYTISERVADKVLVPLGLQSAMYDGTLKLVREALMPEKPQSQYFEE